MTRAEPAEQSGTRDLPAGSFLAAYRMAAPAAGAALAVARRTHGKLRRRARVEEEAWRRASGKCAEFRREGREILVLHAASAGEFEQLKPLLARLDRGRFALVQTFFSPTIFEKAAQSPLFDVACFHPFDLPHLADRFFREIGPSHYIVTRHDLWPNHLAAARRSGVRTILVNANLHPDSIRLRWWARPATRAIYSLFDLVCTGSEAIAGRIRSVAPSVPVEVTGDTRFDQVAERAETHRDRVVLPGWPQEEEARTIVFGSTLPSDDRVIFAALEALFPDGDRSLDERKVRLIYVPHEVRETEVGRLVRRFGEAGVSVCRFRHWPRDGRESQPRALLVDVVGILPELYRLGVGAFVGGGFGAGVHSVIEPAVHGAVVAHGPRIALLDEAVSMARAGVSTIVRTPAELADWISWVIGGGEGLERARTASRRFVEAGTGASDRVLERIFPDSEGR